MSGLAKLIQQLRHPSDEFTPIPFWFLNDELNRDELTRQLRDFRDKGVNGVVVHPRIGIPESLHYLSDEYFALMRHIAQTARDLDMRLVLYDEAMYPSGSAHGEVVKANREFASIGLIKTHDQSKGKLIAALDNGMYLVQVHSGGTIRGIHYGEDDGEQNAPPSADILNPDAVALFIQLTHDQYYAHLREYFGTTVIGFFTDEPCILGRNVTGFVGWTDDFEREILDAGGCLAELAGLFDQAENATTAIYHRLIQQRLNSVYYGRLSDWCEAHGIALMGHPECSDDIEEQQYFHIPGQDLVFRRVSPEAGGLAGLDSVQAKCSADAARILHRRRNSNECFGVCARKDHPWHLTGGDMKWFIDWLAVRGVNLLFPHAFYYSLRDARKDERPPDMGPNNIWWPHYKQISDYIKRVCFLMTDCKNCAEVAVVCESGHMPVDEVMGFYECQIGFDYVPRSWLKLAGPYRYYLTDRDEELPGQRISTYNEVEQHDFVLRERCADLRVAHLVKDGVQLYFLTNEADEAISFQIDRMVEGAPIAFDPWSGECYRLADDQLTLARRQSLVILLDVDHVFSAPEKKERVWLDLHFALQSEGDNQKVYEAVCHVDEPNRAATLGLEGEEMAECYCNGRFAGASFWSPHEFQIGPLMKPGENDIRVVFTGSAANRFATDTIPFGMK